MIDLTKYILPKGRTPETIVDNLIFDELGQEALAHLNATFKGRKGIEYATEEMPQQGQPIRFSNTPRALYLNQVVRELTGDSISLLSPQQVLDNWDKLPERDSTYADTDSVVLFPNEGSNEDHRQRVLGILGIQQRLEGPLIVSGLTVLPAHNQDGFTFEPTDYISHELAPWLSQDGKKQGISAYTPSDQSGLRRLYRDRVELYARDDRLLNAYVSGRVQFAQDPKDPRKNLEASLEEEFRQMESRLTAARHFLRTGETPN